MNIYARNDYREILRQSLEERRQLDPKASFQRMAEAMRIQKSYLSKVIGDSAELSQDQLYLACEYLGFSEEQREYMELLLELARYSLKARKDKLAAQIRKIQIQHRRSDDDGASMHVDEGARMSVLTEYYLDPLIQLTHISLLIPRYNRSPALLAQDLGASPQRVLECIGKLERMRIIERKGSTIRVLKDDLHLPGNEPVFRAYRNQMRLMAANRIESASDETTFNFAAVFSADLETRNRIQSEFLDLLKRVEKLIKNAPSEDTFQISFDLFSWTKL